MAEGAYALWMLEKPAGDAAGTVVGKPAANAEGTEAGEQPCTAAGGGRRKKRKKCADVQRITKAEVGKGVILQRKNC